MLVCTGSASYRHANRKKHRSFSVRAVWRGALLTTPTRRNWSRPLVGKPLFCWKPLGASRTLAARTRSAARAASESTVLVFKRISEASVKFTGFYSRATKRTFLLNKSKKTALEILGKLQQQKAKQRYSNALGELPKIFFLNKTKLFLKIKLCSPFLFLSTDLTVMLHVRISLT